MKKDTDISILTALYSQYFGHAPISVQCLPGAGSGRVYYRLCGEESGRKEKLETAIGVIGENEKDSKAFLSLTPLLAEYGVSVPKLFCRSESEMDYLQEDLGDTSLFDVIKKGRDEADSSEYDGLKDLVADALRGLARFQTIPQDVWGEQVEYQPFSRRQIFWDLNYFKYEYLRPVGASFDEERLEDDFEKLAEILWDASGNYNGLMYRDFQSRNVMVKDNHCYFIDYQGARKGPSLYDAVSFLWQAKAGFSDDCRREMMDIYAEEYSKLIHCDKEDFLAPLPYFVLFRTLQVLGAYGLRGLIEKKAHFLESIPGALGNLKSLIDEGVLDAFPELRKVGEEITSDMRFIPQGKRERLRVEVFSFSYKKGYPADFSGNGGGFMFDCRGMHNPGRYPEYKTLTGMDQPVIDFLREKGETDLFSERVVELVAPTVERYIRRGFSNLQIGFGCTGGQHRSVYCAEKVSKALAERFSEAEVTVCHREQGVNKKLS